MLELKNVTKSYGVLTVVDGCDITVKDGEFVTLLGPSGSGKSTILSMIAGFTPLSSGSIEVDGRDITRLSAAERGIGVVFQNYALFPHLSVFENIAYGLRRRRWSADRIRSRVGEMLDLIGLDHIAERRPEQLSGGQQQRVALARALAFEPTLLLMDEPLGALDREIRDQMQAEIRRIHRETRPSVVYVTHNREEAFALSDRIAVLQLGKLMGFDTPQSLYERPPNGFIASFFGALQMFDVTARATGAGQAEVTFLGARAAMPSAAGLSGPARLAIAARSIGLESSDLPRGFVIEALVTERVYMGDSVRIAAVHEPTGTAFTAERDTREFAAVGVGDRVNLNLDIQNASLIAA